MFLSLINRICGNFFKKHFQIFSKILVELG